MDARMVLIMPLMKDNIDKPHISINKFELIITFIN